MLDPVFLDSCHLCLELRRHQCQHMDIHHFLLGQEYLDIYHPYPIPRHHPYLAKDIRCFQQALTQLDIRRGSLKYHLHLYQDIHHILLVPVHLDKHLGGQEYRHRLYLDSL